MQLSDRRTLGRSGLPVSPLALGTMTFGQKSWGSPGDLSAAVFHAFLDAGGNFLDTADVYSGGESETILGRLIAERKLRDSVVLATKFSFAGGNGRKHLQHALEGSLRRLGTDFVDLYWLHVWDGVTPAEEILQSMGDLVRAGRIRYFGLSNIPAWFATRICTLAEAHGVPGPIALQLEYSLVARSIEGEFLPAARALGLGITPWSPLAGGFLTGKYTREDAPAGKGRLGGSNPFQGEFTKFTDRNWRILDALREGSQALGVTPAQAALAWTMAQPGVSSLILGARDPAQLGSNIASLAVTLTPQHLAALDTASAPESSPYAIFSPAIRRSIFGGRGVEGWFDS